MANKNQSRVVETTIERWSGAHEHLSFRVDAEPGHVSMQVTESGYVEGAPGGLSKSGSPEKMADLVVALRALADALSAACSSASNPTTQPNPPPPAA